MTFLRSESSFPIYSAIHLFISPLMIEVINVLPIADNAYVILKSTKE